MQTIGRKIYYNSISGEVILITGEMKGDCRLTSFDEDLKNYPQLQDKNPSDISCIILNYGERPDLNELFKTVHVDVTTDELVIEHYTIEELELLNTI